MRKFVNVSDLEALAINTLSVYFASGKIDRSAFLAPLRKCLGIMGSFSVIKKQVILELQGCSVQLPSDFRSVIRVIVMGGYQVTHTTPSNTVQFVSEKPQEGTCFLECCQDECGNLTKVIKYGGERVTYWDSFQQVLSYEQCDYGNTNSVLKDHFKIDGSTLYTNFSGGTLLLEYNADPEVDGSFQVPDYPLVKDWVYKELVYGALYHLFMQGEDVFQKLQMAERVLSSAELNARDFLSRFTKSQMSQVKRKVSGLNRHIEKHL